MNKHMFLNLTAKSPGAAILVWWSSVFFVGGCYSARLLPEVDIDPIDLLNNHDHS